MYYYRFRTLSGILLLRNHNIYENGTYYVSYNSALESAINKGYTVEIFYFEEEYIEALCDEIHSMYSDSWN